MAATAQVVAAALRSGPLRRVLLACLLFNTAELATWLAILVWAFGRGWGNAAGLIAFDPARAGGPARTVRLRPG
jgi:hypothetical protein